MPTRPRAVGRDRSPQVAQNLGDRVSAANCNSQHRGKQIALAAIPIGRFFSVTSYAYRQRKPRDGTLANAVQLPRFCWIGPGTYQLMPIDMNAAFWLKNSGARYVAVLTRCLEHSLRNFLFAEPPAHVDAPGKIARVNDVIDL